MRPNEDVSNAIAPHITGALAALPPEKRSDVASSFSES